MTLARALAALALGAACAAAHDLTIRIELAEPAVIVRASYDGAEPAANADIAITSPEQLSGPFQSGAADRNGRFAFVPDVPGVWSVSVDDGFGHRREQTVQVDWNAAAGSPAPRRDWRNVALGLGVILGLTGLFYWSRARNELRSLDAKSDARR